MAVQQLNDAFRTLLSADLGRVVMTSGVARLEPETVALILDAVRAYDQFDEDIDPYGGARYGPIHRQWRNHQPPCRPEPGLVAISLPRTIPVTCGRLNLQFARHMRERSQSP